MTSRRVIVTGASSGIGAAAALQLAEAGHSLCLTARRADRLHDVQEACLQSGARRVMVVPGDLTVPGTREELAESLLALGEGEPVLVNNAGFGQFGSFHEQPWSTIESHFRLMLEAPILLTQAVLPEMLAHGGGLVVNVASITTKLDFPKTVAYTTAKTGLVGFGRAVLAEYRAQGIRVTTLVPGATETEIWDAHEAHPPFEQMMPAAAVAETIAWVISLPPDRVVEEIVLTPPRGVL